ncbi:head-tail adaptor protein [Lysobacter sp. 5GHs7-4]|uniref:head-tail adaptor protein n=1 Tax=Lysobacter sp. 5GHs7-4 TaxID=2904253 RepID=UPI001E598CA8|nr:head-tail adaptor protein [Lysobacter sp. 5GHs7-4]UHQ21889.1 head-tail adaptor protein [Lysobacter sp. 5GHs7-4]
MLTQRLRHRIDIEQLVDLEDSNGFAQQGPQGEPLRQWVAVLEGVPAEVAPKSAREFVESAAPQTETAGRMTIRTPSVPITSDMRVVWQGKTYKLLGVLPDPSDRRWLTLIYSLGLNDGE